MRKAEWKNKDEGGGRLGSVVCFMAELVVVDGTEVDNETEMVLEYVFV